MDDNCLICGNSLGAGDVATVIRGRITLVEASLRRKHGLSAKLESISPLILHTVCRKDHTGPTSIKANTSKILDDSPSQDTSETKTPSLRSFLETFDFKV